MEDCDGDTDAVVDGDKKCYDIKQFEILKIVGKGAFARVCLCLHRPSSLYFALKILPDHEVGSGRVKQVEHVRCEMEILKEMSHPFLIPLLWSSQDSSNPVLLFPYISGGLLYTHLRKAMRFSSSTTLFFSAEVVSALSYLHSLNIVHRDLTPQNILLDKEGHVVIIDFGFSKIIPERSWTMCGTQKYMAPEIIECAGHDKGVDWWALGIIIYEMLVGYQPFFDDNPFLIAQKILTEDIKWPRNMDSVAKDFIENLLERDRTKRLGSTGVGAEDAKNHRFFKTLNWEDVYHKRLKPPIVPKAKTEGDARNI